MTRERKAGPASVPRGGSKRSGSQPDDREKAAGPELEPLVRELRGSLANLRSASEALDLVAHPDESIDARQLRAVVIFEAARLSGLIDRLDAALQPLGRPAGAALSVGGLLALLAQDVENPKDGRPEVVGEVESEVAALRLAGGAALVAPLLATLLRLRNEHAVGRVHLRARLHQDLVSLDLSWPASEPAIWRLREANAELLAAAPAAKASLRAVVQTLGGEVWLTVDSTAASASLRLLLQHEPASSRNRRTSGAG